MIFLSWSRIFKGNLRSPHHHHHLGDHQDTTLEQARWVQADGRVGVLTGDVSQRVPGDLSFVTVQVEVQ